MMVDYFFLQRNRKTILLGTDLGEVKEFNFMTGQVRENFSRYCHRHCQRSYIGHLIIVFVNFLIIIITVFQPSVNTFFISFLLGKSVLQVQWERDFHVPMFKGEKDLGS